LSIAPSRFANATLALALIVLPILGISASAFAEGSEPQPSSTGVSHGERNHAKPTPTPKGTPIPNSQVQPGQDDEQDEVSQKQSQISKKYGDEREVATPPLIVKPANPLPKPTPSSSGVSVSAREASTKLNGASVQNLRKPVTKYVSQPLNVARHQLNQQQQSSTSQSATDSQVKAFDAAKNAPVIHNIRRDELGSPAQEFLAKAYFGMAVMVTFGALLVLYVLRKQKVARGSDQNDG
jgi:hypothetical protein